MGAVSSKLCSVSWRAGDPEEPGVPQSPNAASWRFPSCVEARLTDWMRPTYIYLLDPKSPDLNVNLFQNHSPS